MKSRSADILKMISFFFLAAAIILLPMGWINGSLSSIIVGSAAMLCWAVLFGFSHVVERLDAPGGQSRTKDDETTTLS